MLVRAARRKVRPDTIRSRISCDHPHMPWPRSTHIAYPGSRRWGSIDTGSKTIESRKRANSKDIAKQPARRSLATAYYGPYAGASDDIPFEGMGSMTPSRSGFERDLAGLSKLTSSKPHSIILAGSSLVTSPPKHKMRGDIGFSGTSEDFKSVFEACLQVGRIERAEVILKRLLTFPELTPDEVLDLHIRYLRGSVEQIIMHSSQAATQRLHSWFEMEMRSKNVPIDFETLAYMVKASLQSPPEQRTRLVRRYMDMLEEDAALQLLMAEILTAREINEITHIYPKYNFVQQIIEDEDVPDSKEAYHEESTTLKLVPAVRATDQRGLGLKSLKKSLSLFSKLSDEGFNLSGATLQEKRDIQERLEKDAVDSAVDRWREESENLNKMGIDSQLQTKSLGARMWKWEVDLERYLREELVLVEEAEVALNKTSRQKKRCIIGPFLRVLPPDKLAAVTILSMMKVMGSQGPERGISLATAITAIAGSVEDEAVFMSLQKNSRRKIWPEDGSSQKMLTPELLLKATKSRGPGYASRLVERYGTRHNRKYVSQTPWSVTTKAQVGAFLMSALIEVAKVPVTLTQKNTENFVTQMQPAFAHSHMYKMGKKLGIITVNKVLVSQLKSEPVSGAIAKHLPMLVEPEPWTGFSQGGFLAYPSRVIRVKHGDQDQRYYAEAAVGQGDMTQIFKGLNILGKTAWQINQPVFDVMLEAWNSGEAIASIPAENPVVETPPEPLSSQDPMERRRWITAVKAAENIKSGMHSQRCFQNFQLEIARALRNETFYFPHNMDFRGRAYPIPPYLNHMGADHCRGILRFGVGKKLGSGGLRWLKIHLSNVYGYDKASLTERENFATDNIGEIYDSATNALGGRRWWLQAEDPWQCLAACIELRNALESGNPEEFASHLPIHQDGTCNGLQHYAALGGDSWGAKQVNLEPGDRPADVYTAVANLVIESIDRDLKAGDERAVILQGKVSRKTVKQTVMTNVYGVTYSGAKAQVRKQLATDTTLATTKTHSLHTLSSYIATKIFTALSSMFRGAHDIQYWLGECAQRISTSMTPEQLNLLEGEWPRLRDIAMGKIQPDDIRRSVDGYRIQDVEQIMQFKTSVIWTNPLHMPVVQPYRKGSSKVIRTNMQYISLMDPHRSDPIDKRKQLQGFPPNFIHSLDATHMLLSALKCDELGLSFAAVHDSFWTHACDIPTMNGVLRDAFIQIHSEDVIGRLEREFVARYRGAMYCQKIKLTSPVYKAIKSWREKNFLEGRLGKRAKKGAIPKIEELILEHQRMKLLNSSDPEEVKKGQGMVTPGSIFAEMAGNADLATEADLEKIGLGDIPARDQALAANEQITVGDKTNIEEIDNPFDGEELDSALADRAESVDFHADPIEPEFMDEISGGGTKPSASEMGTFEKSLKKKRQSWILYSEVWLPMVFPPVPKKGDFDVSRLKNSAYFFS